jgi:hypothetical protein
MVQITSEKEGEKKSISREKLIEQMKIEVYDLMFNKGALLQQVAKIDEKIQSLTKEIHSPGQ